MAVGALRVSVVLAIGLCLGPAAGSAVATGIKEISLSLHLKDPQDVTAARGQPATLQCEAQASGPVSWSWLFEGSPIAANDSRRLVRDDGALFVPAMQKRLRGRYQCLARNEVGAVLSNPATLRIASFGAFLEQPGNTSVAELQPVVLPCKVASVPKAVVWWERDGKPLPLSTRYVPLPSGALLITSTQSSDTGLYRCLTTNKIFPKIKHSNIGQLTVLPPLKRTEPLQFLPLELEPNVTVIAGNNLTLLCSVTGWPAPHTQWLFNGSVVLENSSTLQLHNVSGAATGDYSCIARNRNSERPIVQDYFVQVYEPPHFNVTPTSISYPSARTVRLDCQAKGNPQPKIHWLMNGEPLVLVGRYIMKQNGLVISHSFTTDVGLYQCVAENAAGRAWVAVQLVPYAAENRPNPPKGVQCWPFDDNSVCLVWKSPANSGMIKAYSIYGYITDPTSIEKPHDYVTNGTHILADGLSSDTNYTFYVRSYSKDASDQSNNVSCQAGLKGERNLHVEYLSENSVKLAWSNVSTDHPCSTAKAIYRVQWKRVDQSSVNVENTMNLYKVVTGLRPSVAYEFRVQSATNKNDDSPWVLYSSREKSSSEVAITTQDYAQGDNISDLLMPQQLEVEPLTPYSVNLTWLGSTDDKVFHVCYVEVKEDKNCENGQLIKSNINQMVIKNLKPNTLYEFQVRAQSFKGLISPFSHSVQVQTDVDIPSAVQDLKYRVVNDTTVCVRWRAPQRKNGKLTRYVVSYTPDKNWPLDKWLSLDVNVSKKYIKNCWPVEEDAISMVLTKLDPDSNYTVLVRAATDAGLGNLTLPLSFITRGTSASSYHPNLTEPFDNGEDLYYKQKLGVALGISISLLCIVCCVSCIIFRRRCVKRQALARARLTASGNYYTANPGAPYPSTSLQVRQQESCAAEAHEMQHLVGDDGTTHVPPITPTHLDTKGGVGFPNGQLNGTLKQHTNGHMANGHVHITENPRYDFHECNGHLNTNKPKQDAVLPLLRAKEPKRAEDVPPENGKLRKPDYNWNCNSGEMCKLSSSDDDLNATQLTRLDDSFKSHRRISPALGPNG